MQNPMCFFVISNNLMWRPVFMWSLISELPPWHTENVTLQCQPFCNKWTTMPHIPKFKANKWIHVVFNHLYKTCITCITILPPIGEGSIASLRTTSRKPPIKIPRSAYERGKLTSMKLLISGPQMSQIKYLCWSILPISISIIQPPQQTCTPSKI